MVKPKNWHVTKKGPMKCEAKSLESCPVKLADGTKPEHFGDFDAAQSFYEATMEDKIHTSLKKPDLVAAPAKAETENTDPMGFLPGIHKDIYRTSDAFYNLSGANNPEVFDRLAEYHFWRRMTTSRSLRNMDPQELDAARANTILAKQAVLKTEVGRDWHGFSSDARNLPEGFVSDGFGVPDELTRRQQEPQHLADFNTPRSCAETKELIATTTLDSANFMKKLTPEEANMIAYWTGAGSTVGAAITYGQNGTNAVVHTTRDEDYADDEEDPRYVDGEKFMSTLDSALSKAELDVPRVVYRGVNISWLGDSAAEEFYQEPDENGEKHYPATDKWIAERGLIPGARVKFDMPQSSTSNPGVAKRFSHGVIYEIEAHRAGPVAAVSAWGAFEHEYILPRDTDYEVVAVHHDVPYQKREDREDATNMTVVQLRQL